MCTSLAVRLMLINVSKKATSILRRIFWKSKDRCFRQLLRIRSLKVINNTDILTTFKFSIRRLPVVIRKIMIVCHTLPTNDVRKASLLKMFQEIWIFQVRTLPILRSEVLMGQTIFDKLVQNNFTKSSQISPCFHLVFVFHYAKAHLSINLNKFEEKKYSCLR